MKALESHEEFEIIQDSKYLVIRYFVWIVDVLLGTCYRWGGILAHVHSSDVQFGRKHEVEWWDVSWQSAILGSSTKEKL